MGSDYHFSNYWVNRGDAMSNLKCIVCGKTFYARPYIIKKEQGRKLKRYPCIQGYGLYKGGMYIVEEQKD